MLRPALLTCALFLSFHTAAAQSHQSDVHEHGVARLDAALDGETLALMLHGPAYNFAGFEHHPQTAEEEQAWHTAQSRLKAAEQLFILPAQAGCTVRQVSVSADAATQQPHAHAHAEAPPAPADSPAAAARRGSHHHDREHDHDHDDHEHHDWQASYTFHCDRPDALTQIDVRAFALFPHTETIRFQLQTPTAQSGGSLDAASTLIAVPQS